MWKIFKKKITNLAASSWCIGRFISKQSSCRGGAGCRSVEDLTGGRDIATSCHCRPLGVDGDVSEPSSLDHLVRSWPREGQLVKYRVSGPRSAGLGRAKVVWQVVGGRTDWFRWARSGLQYVDGWTSVSLLDHGQPRDITVKLPLKTIIHSPVTIVTNPCLRLHLHRKHVSDTCLGHRTRVFIILSSETQNMSAVSWKSETIYQLMIYTAIYLLFVITNSNEARLKLRINLGFRVGFLVQTTWNNIHHNLLDQFYQNLKE